MIRSESSVAPLDIGMNADYSQFLALLVPTSDSQYRPSKQFSRPVCGIVAFLKVHSQEELKESFRLSDAYCTTLAPFDYQPL